MGELGDILKQARSSKGISLREVAEKIRVLPSTLAALEAEALPELPPITYTRGLLGMYARYLGLDANYMVELLDRHGSHQPTSLVEIPTVVTERSAPWGVFIIGLTLAAVAGFVALQTMVRQPAGIASPSERAGVSRSALTSGQPTEANGEAAVVARNQPDIGDKTVLLSPGSPEGGPPLAIQVQAKRLTWLLAMVDDRLAFEGDLPPGETLDWAANQQVLLRTSDAEGIWVSINGGLDSPLGLVGESVEREWRVFE